MKREEFKIQISAGRGPAECGWVVARIFEKISKLVIVKDLDIQEIEIIKGAKKDSLASVAFVLKGFNVEKFIEGWIGTIQWIGQSPYRKNHKRKNWFVGLSLVESEENLSFRESEVTYKSFRASGPGGQHRNKVETAIRATHVPSSISASSTKFKSQKQNKQMALEQLKKIFLDQSIQKQKIEIENQWKDHLSIERGNPVKVFEGERFREKKRIGVKS